MLIRSQNKLLLTNLENVTDIAIGCIEENRFDVRAFLINCTETELGRYSTEEKAITVLGMIENAYDNYNYSRFLGSDKTSYESSTFVMPQDEEVKA